MTSTVVHPEPRAQTQPAEHLHGTLPPAVMAALVPRSVPPQDAFEAWEDGAYVLAYLRQNGPR